MKRMSTVMNVTIVVMSCLTPHLLFSSRYTLALLSELESVEAVDGKYRHCSISPLVVSRCLSSSLTLSFWKVDDKHH